MSDRGVFFNLSQKDEGHLRKIADQLGDTRPIARQKNTIIPEYPNAYLALWSKRIGAKLASYGLHRPKTYTAKTPISLLFNRDYWRGVVDGDGTICISSEGRAILALIGSRFICGEFLDFCRSHGSGNRVNICNHKSIFSVHINGLEAIRIARVLYDGAGMFLDRKMEIYRNKFLPHELAQ